MPPAKKPATKPSVIDQLAEDAIPDEYPAGTPELLPYLQIRPRTRRAEFKRAYAQFAELQEKVSSIGRDALAEDAPVAVKMRAWADLDEVYGAMEELLALAAADADAFQAWVVNANDELLAQVFQIYAKRSQPGEASSSAS